MTPFIPEKLGVQQVLQNESDSFITLIQNRLRLHKKHKNAVTAVFCLTGMLLLGSCGVHNETASTRVNTNTPAISAKIDNGVTAAAGEVITKAPQIIFLDFSIRKTPAGNSEVSVINKIVTNGQLKKGLPENQDFNTGDLRCVALDENARPIQSINIANPLVRTVEYLNESGQLSKKDIELDSTQFSIRMQLDATTEAIAIEQKNAADAANTILVVTKIK